MFEESLANFEVKIPHMSNIRSLWPIKQTDVSMDNNK